MQQDYGFQTIKKVTFLKAKQSDVKDIVKLYRRNTYQRRQTLLDGWCNLIKKSQKDFNNVVFVIRDKCNHLIGLLEMETDDGKNFDIGIWIPNKAKQTQYLNHIKESFLEWVEDETAIEKIKSIKVLREMKENPGDTEFDVIGNDITFETVSC